MSETSAVVEKSLRSVFVGNIPYEATEEKLREIFSQVGPVLSFKLMHDRESGKPKGYGFCEYKDQETALSAMRNLNTFEIGGRPLRVDNACTEKSRMEMQSLMMGPVVESPYGPEVEASQAPEAISNAVASLPPEQMFELMRQMQVCVRSNRTEARTMLLNNPQLAYALLQAQVVMRIIDPKTAVQLLHGEPGAAARPGVGGKLELLNTTAPTTNGTTTAAAPTNVVVKQQPRSPPKQPPVPAPTHMDMSQSSGPPQHMNAPPQHFHHQGPPPQLMPSQQMGPMAVPPPAGPTGPRPSGPSGAPPHFPGGDFEHRSGAPPRGPDMDMRMPPSQPPHSGSSHNGPPPQHDFPPHHQDFDSRFGGRGEGRDNRGSGDFDQRDPRYSRGADPRDSRDSRDSRDQFGRDGRGSGGGGGLDPRDPRSGGTGSRDARPDGRGDSDQRDFRGGEAQGGPAGLRDARDPRGRPPPPLSNVHHEDFSRGPPPAVPAPVAPPTAVPAPLPANLPAGLAGQDKEKASLILQVLQLSDEQIRMLPPEQQTSILQLKDQIQRSSHH